MLGYSYDYYGYFGYYGLAYRDHYSRNYYPSNETSQKCLEDDLDCLIEYDSLNDKPYALENPYSLAYSSDHYLPKPGEKSYSFATYENE